MGYSKTTWQNGVTPVNADNMNKIEDGIANALAKPEAILSSNELVGVGVNGEQVRIQLGEGLTLEGSTSPYTLKASGGGGSGFIFKCNNIQENRRPTLHFVDGTSIIATSNVEYKNVVWIKWADFSSYTATKQYFALESMNTDETIKFVEFASTTQAVNGHNWFLLSDMILTSIFDND